MQFNAKTRDFRSVSPSSGLMVHRVTYPKARSNAGKVMVKPRSHNLCNICLDIAAEGRSKGCRWLPRLNIFWMVDAFVDQKVLALKTSQQFEKKSIILQKKLTSTILKYHVMCSRQFKLITRPGMFLPKWIIQLIESDMLRSRERKLYYSNRVVTRYIVCGNCHYISFTYVHLSKQCQLDAKVTLLV